MFRAEDSDIVCMDCFKRKRGWAAREEDASVQEVGRWPFTVPFALLMLSALAFVVGLVVNTWQGLVPGAVLLAIALFLVVRRLALGSDGTAAPQGKEITVEMQREMAANQLAASQQEPQEVPHGTIVGPFTVPADYPDQIGDELDAIEQEGEGMENQGIGMKRVVTRLRMRFGFVSKRSRQKEKEVVRQ